jgi:chromosome segregation ATPase
MEQKSIALIETSQQVNSLKLAAVESEATITKLSEKTHTLLLERDRLVDKISAQQTQTKGLIEKNKALTEENLKHSNALNELINVYIQEKSHMERNIVNLTQERDQLTNEASKLSKSLIQLQVRLRCLMMTQPHTLT